MDWQDDLLRTFPEWRSDAERARWQSVRPTLSIDQQVVGRVVARAPFGVWLDVGVSVPALLLVPRMFGADRASIAFEDYPKIGEDVNCRICALGNRGEIGVLELPND